MNTMDTIYYDVAHDGYTGTWCVQRIDFFNDVEVHTFSSFEEVTRWIKQDCGDKKAVIW